MMKNKLVTLLLLISTCAVFLLSCKKKKEETPDPGPHVFTSVLCDGNGSTSYYPLTVGNVWNYSDGGSNGFSKYVSTTTTFGAITYYIINGALGGTQYLRQAANGDIMTYDSGTSSEVLFIPASPTVGQSWTYNLESAVTRKVVGINESLTTSCDYTGCLKIQTFKSGGMLVHTYYYKKGIGMISMDQIALMNITLK